MRWIVLNKTMDLKKITAIYRRIKFNYELQTCSYHLINIIEKAHSKTWWHIASFILPWIFNANINIVREEIIENRLDGTFQFDYSSSLMCEEVNVSKNAHNNNNSNNNNNDETEFNDM